MKYGRDFLKFLNLLDRGGKFSITNFVLYAVVIKLLISPFDPASVGALLAAIANYAHKRKESAQAEKAAQDATKASEVMDEVIKLTARVKSTEDAQQSFASLSGDLKKQAEAVQKLVSQQQVAGAFKLPNRQPKPQESA